jgi:hypothetical protein
MTAFGATIQRVVAITCLSTQMGFHSVVRMLAESVSELARSAQKEENAVTSVGGRVLREPNVRQPGTCLIVARKYRVNAVVCMDPGLHIASVVVGATQPKQTARYAGAEKCRLPDTD